ncbi:hypothetical protein FORC88_1102 [Salmonella enterica subsp. enterica serovar Typhimurium]|nr:hypothetical protein SEEOR701_04846 [Salmonella enterica subsp. enterica serovar Oranienburg str. 701]ESH29125.1 hypothetical protein SEEGA711_00517 [Salmonella enterica subsp. enterica serovar Gaminara str. ATCC BAA-711]QCK18252.1 hypothetical protein FORC88_1102 [Salmonella enterica subsp. enterica serovar Typhimurium]
MKFGFRLIYVRMVAKAKRQDWGTGFAYQTPVDY